MQFYVPATRADGTLTVVEYYADRDGDNQPDELIETREYAKPLIASYFNEVVESEGNATSGHAESAVVAAVDPGGGDFTARSGMEVGPELHRDAWVSFSLDDGQTWKEHNISESAFETSFTLENGTEFPGDVPEVVHAVAGNQILVAWTSKYCDQGSPRYSVKADSDLDGNGVLDDPLYPDLFDVAGNQGSFDYAEWMHHGTYPFAEVGEIPFSCVWTARGTLEQVTNPQTSLLQWGIRWRKAERLTSGKRNAYRVTVDGVEDAGFAVTWQEDPKGLRPGYGEGPGIGWSGATVNHKTDIWYSSIGWTDFVSVDTSTQDPETNKPKVAVHMAMPMRVTDNYNCLSDRVDSDGNPHPGFCFADFNSNGTPDLCAATYPWTNSKGETKNICVTEDGRLLNGQTGSSRPRMELQGYTKADGTKSAWVILTYEETKGLGAGHSDIEPLDIGKDVMYHSFDMFTPEFVAPGTMMNMPETDPASNSETPTILLPVLNDKGEYQYQTTIGRRPSLLIQPSATIAAGKTSAIVLYKDGYDRQGGPSDIFMRRLVVPEGFNPNVDNPYDVANFQCAEADTSIVSTAPSAYPASAYPNGVCLRGAVNVSGANPLTFEALDNTSSPELPAGHPPVTTDCSVCHEGSGYDDGLPSHGITERVLTWEQTAEDLGDEAWENKYEVAKGHRGFIDGDFVMVMYAYSPNWLATSHGHEPYNLYIRRSFDGGVTWTTTPASFGGDGTIYDQVFGVGDRTWAETRTLGAGEFEPARNVSQLTSNKETVLDPRYSPTNIGTQQPVTRILQPDGTYTTLLDTYEDDAVRDPSRFFAVFETGDATTVEEGGEADPLDLFYSRATNYGDDWDTMDVFAQGRGEWKERWDWLENKDDDMSGEASIAASPGGDFMWAVWNQWKEDADGHVYDSDPIFRRLWWDYNEDPIANAGGPYETILAAESSTATTLVILTGSAIDPDGDEIVSYAWDLDSDGIFETYGQQVNIPATGGPQAVALHACDSRGACDVDTAWVNRPNPHTPRVWRISPEFTPALNGSMVNFTAKFNAPGTSAISSVVWNWGDGSAPEPSIMPDEQQGKGASFVTGSHRYGQAGVYPVTLTVTNAEGLVGFDTEYVAIYDPSAGFITGEGWILSPSGFLIGVDQEQKLTFQFDAKYDKNNGYLKGQVTLSLNPNRLSFASTGLDWLAIEPDGMAHLKGVGSLDGTDGYEFLITVKDGGKKGVDLARIRIWHSGAGKNGHVVYDSQIGTHIGADAFRPLGGGNVTLHTDKVKIDEVEQTDVMTGSGVLYLPTVNK